MTHVMPGNPQVKPPTLDMSDHMPNNAISPRDMPNTNTITSQLDMHVLDNSDGYSLSEVNENEQSAQDENIQPTNASVSCNKSSFFILKQMHPKMQAMFDPLIPKF